MLPLEYVPNVAFRIKSTFFLGYVCDSVCDGIPLGCTTAKLH